MEKLKMMQLLKAAVGQIEAFEEDEAENVLKSLGFTKNDLAEIRTEIHINDEDKENVVMVEGKIFHNGEVVWILNSYGAKYIFSDQKETEMGWITECVPFKNYSHYIHIDEDRDKPLYTGFSWYSKIDSYVYDFSDLKECLDWLVGEED